MSAPPDPNSPAGDVTGGLDAESAAVTRADVVVGRSQSGDPGATFGRYLRLQLLGSGGMATVYRAHDPLLGRVVALKLIRGDEPDLTQRLLLEARAQARIEHPHVCRVYEAGSEGGRPYIAMQFVDGVTLRALASQLSLEQKLKLMEEVAEGVHAAHRVGLVHRDLKPANVMVERREDGSYKPYVMDFGVARELAAPGLTRTGVVLGTPWYMSPEQARGETRTLDRRSDVYSLGATLYELIGGVPPFQGESSIDVLVRVINEEPLPLSRVRPGTPIDVQTIVSKCLEKEPARRYDSARALAEDLQRYLDGEPILARPTGAVTRLLKRARKNRIATGVVLAALAAAIAFAALGLSARASARTQAQLAAEFAQSVKDVEWLMRVAHMAPQHDVSRERALVRERLAQLSTRMRAAGPLARGPGEYALGRGELALEHPAAARQHLETAWNAGFRTPDVAYGLGLALGALYQTELQLCDAIGNAQLRAARRGEIQKLLRDPAVSYLRQGVQGGSAPPDYVLGLLAFYEKRYDEALQRAGAALESAPWLYEAHLLTGSVNAVQSRVRHETGDEPGSQAALRAAEASYRSAADYARSDATPLEGLCQVGLQRMEAALYERRPLAEIHDATIAACRSALELDPERAEIHARLANVERFWANSLQYQGREAAAALDEAEGHARRALALDPESRRGHGNLGVIYRQRAENETSHGRSPDQALGLALQELKKAADLSGSDASSLNDLGNAYQTRALSAPIDGDPTGDLNAAVRCYDQALEHVPDFGYAHANRGAAMQALARYDLDHGGNPKQHVAEAAASLDRAAALMPKVQEIPATIADTYALEAQFALLVGENPNPALDRARSRLQALEGLGPKRGPEAFAAAARVALIEAQLLEERRESSWTKIEEAHARARAALGADPTWASAARTQIETFVLEARVRGRTSGDPLAALDAASRALDALLVKTPRDGQSLALRPALERQRAEAHIGLHQSASAAIARGLIGAEHALAVDPAQATVLAEQGVLLRLRAEQAADGERRLADARQGIAALTRALEQNANLAHRYRPELDHAQALVQPATSATAQSR